MLIADDCKKRWRNIKDTYFRNIKKRKLGTFSASSQKPTKWTLFDRLSFLDSVKHERASKSNFADEEEETPLESPNEMDCEIGPTDESTLNNSDLFERYLSPSTSRTPGTKFNKILDRDQESSTSESRSSTPLQRNLNKYQLRVSKNSLIAQFEERSQKRMELLKAMHKKKDKTEPEDEVDLFMRSISMTVKKFPPALLNEVIKS
ncbi:unnamed protein product [Brassicogethes aeneus]|uniref:MADF domain-containing protein n=1 Tax=Brassicogethes aeneus TaxID=1431903 RepID=A0A9P0BDB8_BRAAE|nr:unnamed protein product [Brassicogethes aeneus]